MKQGTVAERLAAIRDRAFRLVALSLLPAVEIGDMLNNRLSARRLRTRRSPAPTG